jgi:prolyl-tRNA editing enzyme YbaK/EbsC (Cys-tRNA(Pro) deacylase)
MTAPAHPRVAEIARLLAEAGAHGELRVLSADVRTAAAAAAALGVPVGAVVNSLVFTVGDLPLLILTSGAHRVDERKTAELLGVERITPASAEFVRRHTGQAIGGQQFGDQQFGDQQFGDQQFGDIAPIGHPEPIGTLVDVELARYDTVWAVAGHTAAVFSTTYDELLRLTEGTAAEVGDGPGTASASPASDSAASDGAAQAEAQVCTS